MGEAAKVIVTNESELTAIVERAVAKALAANANADPGASPDDILTSEQAAKLLGKSSRTLRLWAVAGKLPALLSGSTYRFRRGDVLAKLREIRAR